MSNFSPTTNPDQADQMPFCYALVSRKNIPLCQHCAVSGNFDLYYQKFLPKDGAAEGITIYKVDSYIWGIMSEQKELNFLCVFRNDCENSVVNRVLEEIRNRFLRIYGDSWKQATTFSFQSSFEPYLIEISKLTQHKAFQISGIAPPSIEAESPEDPTEENLLKPSEKTQISPLVPAIDQKMTGRRKFRIISIAASAFLLIIVYLIVASICADWTLVKCFTK